MHGTTLRDLSRAYAAGALDRETYRRRRHELLSRIEAGQIAVEAFQAPEPDQRTVFPYDDDEGDTTQEILAPLPSTRAPPVPRKNRTPLFVALVLLAAGGAAAWYWSQHAEPAAPAPAAASAASTTVDPLSEFLAANQWDGPQLLALGARWDRLDDATHASLRDSASLRRLTDKALEQIQAENALITLGDAEEALATQQQLLDLMEHLGAEDTRLRRARQAWRQASADFAHQRVAAAAAAAAQQATAAAPSSTPPPPADAPAPVEAAAPASAAPPPSPVTPSAVDAPPAPAQKPATPAASTAPDSVPVAASQPAATKSARGACTASLAKTRKPYCQDTLANFGKGPALVVLPAGQFEMGGEAAAEQPRHGVTLSRPFAIGLFEVSAAEFAKFCKATHTTCPAQPWSDASLPVVNVSWAAAHAYVQWLSETTGADYRLPSEAQWEYAARAGSTTPYPFGNELLPTHARYSFKASVSTPLPAGDRSVNRNEFKLYHMLGNVREWVADGWRANYDNASADGSAQNGDDGRHVVRGGSYADRAAALRSAARVPLDGNGDQYTGFRVVRMVE